MFKYLNDIKLKNKLIIETGCARTTNKYESGTYYLSESAFKQDAKVISIDWCVMMIERAKQTLDHDNVEFPCAHTHDYLRYLASENAIADFIYLDSANDRYYILTEFKLSLELVEAGSMICIDDYSADKCVLVEKYLKEIDLDYEVYRNKLYFQITEENLSKIGESFDKFYDQFDWKEVSKTFREIQQQYEKDMSYLYFGEEVKT